MSESRGSSWSLQLSGLWFATFVALKITGPLAAWSWWWMLMPIVPDLAFVFEKMGWL